MIQIQGQANRFCDGIARRQFLEVGALSVLGLGLPALLRNEARADLSTRSHQSRSKRSVILVWQHGGPSQLDTFDMKPHAPSEIRGPYGSIASSLAGLPVCEKLPFQAKIMDKCSVIRSFSHGNGDHWAAAHWMLTGRLGANGSDRVPRQPSIGAVASHLIGPRKKGTLASVNFNDGGFGFHGASWLGVSHNPFRMGEFSYGNEAGRLPTGTGSSFELVSGLNSLRVQERLQLKDQFDRLRRDVDVSRTFDSIDSIDQQAADILLSGRTREAFDLSKEDSRVREQYGPGWGEQALLARRLIEAGVRYVSLNTGYWDDHGNIKGRLDDKLPRHDRAVGVLIEDLAQRGLLEDTLVVTAGEFGRTPKINGNAGRDHWPQTQSIMIAGGGYQHGQVIGSTDSQAAYPTSRKVDVEDFCMIVYHALGLKATDTIIDHSGRPQHLVPSGRVPRELL